MKRYIAVRLLSALFLLLTLPLTPGIRGDASAQGGSRTFPETGKTVRGLFLQYWDTHGALAQQGYPISEEMQEVSETNGKTYTVQYFERAVFELHPENEPPNDILLSLLGVFRYKQKYPNGAPDQIPDVGQGSVLFEQTGHRLGGVFYNYWVNNGGLAQQGYPISDRFWEKSDLDGKMYVVQYFERAVFEFHEENKPPYDVLLSQLGTFRYKEKYVEKPIVYQGTNWQMESDGKSEYIFKPKDNALEDIDSLCSELDNPLRPIVASDLESAKQHVKVLGLNSNPQESDFIGFPIYGTGGKRLGTGWVYSFGVVSTGWRPHPTVFYFSAGITDSVALQDMSDSISGWSLVDTVNSPKEENASEYIPRLRADTEVIINPNK